MAESQVAASETPPMTTEDLEGLKDDNGLYAGKFKTIEDMAASYKELEGKLGQSPEEAPEVTEEEPKEEIKDEKKEDSEFNAEELYGEGLAETLKAADIDPQDISTRFTESGEISEEDYTKLENAGFSRSIIDSYLAGVRAQNGQAVEMAERQVQEVKDSVGGDAEYSKVTTWASQNLPPEDVEAFNSLLERGDAFAIRMATQGLYSQYKNAMGTEPSLVSGRSSESGPSPFRTTQEVVAAMRDPRYNSDAAYTENVQRKLASSEVFNIKG